MGSVIEVKEAGRANACTIDQEAEQAICTSCIAKLWSLVQISVVDSLPSLRMSDWA